MSMAKPKAYAPSVDADRLSQSATGRQLLEDLLLAGALGIVAAVSALALVVPLAGPAAPSTTVVIGWSVVLVAPLVFRRRWPLAVMVVMTANFLLYWAVGMDNEFASWVAFGVAVYTAAAQGRPRFVPWVLVACMLAQATVLLKGADSGELTSAAAVAGLLFAWTPFALGWPLGVMMRRLREYRAVLEERNAELAAEREAGAQRAVLRERVLIAQELHDVVAHHVSVMAVQAGAARRLFHSRPGDAVEAIGAVEEAGRAAIVELQQLLGVLRREEPRSLAPQPSLEQLPRLIAGVRQAGLPVTLSVEGRARPMPGGVELSAFRIVQEALTNTLKHGAASQANVVVRYQDGMVEVEVVDDGRPDGQASPRPEAASATAGRDGGRGLLGMRERVSVYGGTLDAGPRPDGGFRVRAVLRSNGS
jgi:signal transduction histidine kinase